MRLIITFVSVVSAALGTALLSGESAAIAGGCATADGESGPIDFSRDVRPILARHCFKCHGPDDKQRQAGMRLDGREAATRPAKGGKRPIVPGRPDVSELVRRVFATDDADVMPPPTTKNPLSATQKETLRRWIAEGAEYKPHWAFIAPKPPPLPRVKNADWQRNPIDYFVLARLEAAGLEPSPQADRFALVRRVYLDLIGLPPTPEEADAFLNDAAPDAYERLVDRLLESPHYGERWARRWLDLARYADTNGYEKDRPRSIWPYRDWVIRAINADMLFDQFTIEQLAGDMLSDATLDARAATGFHRNTMLNEEGGIDPLEFRFHAMTDRVATTATVWLGLTLGCAQCHTHKFDPITQREYYQFMAFLNNADEPEIDVTAPDAAAIRADLTAKIAAIEADLPNRFPPEGEIRWLTPRPATFASAGGATAETLEDGSVRMSGTNPGRDTYTIEIESAGDAGEFTALRLEAMTDPALPKTGPGRAPHGNFVLSEIAVSVAPRDKPDDAQPIKLVRTEADFAQDGFPAAHAIDGDAKTGWAIHGKDPWNVTRAATFHFDKPAGFADGSRWTIRLDQQHGGQHTLGRVRISLGKALNDDRPLDVRRREHLERKFAEWLDRETARTVNWTLLRPVAATSNLPLLTIQADGSIFASGDQSKRDEYVLTFVAPPRGITAIRLEAMPDERLPKHGPGRVYYEGPHGDFWLSDIKLSAGDCAAKFSRATQSFASGSNNAAAAIDDNLQTGWSVNGGQGRSHNAVFNVAEPLDLEATAIELRLLFERYHAAGLGRFRVWATTDARPAEARAIPNDIEAILSKSDDDRDESDRERLVRLFCTVAPELVAERAKIQKLRDQFPAPPTTLVMQERPASNPRRTFVHRRGEFLQPTDPVEPGVPAFLPPLVAGSTRDRLTFARWLVDPANPLVGRVTMNRQWAAFFGRGLVRTTEDFGYQGELPTHPELLDWLAVEFVRQGWSLKKMHRLIVTSATYQQSSRVTPKLLARDPNNERLARGPRFRLEAELVRDAALRASGLLSTKLGGPSVYPPQPPGVTTEGAYGALAWKVSEGDDRYRRGLYTFAKRTTPYAMFTTFDAPSGEACVARREVSNTPLQALTLLNDAVFFEAAQALGRMIAARPGSTEDRAAYLFRRCLTRPPTADELAAIVRFFDAQRRRFAANELDAAAIAGPGEGDATDRAAWTVTARSLLNLDEQVTKN